MKQVYAAAPTDELEALTAALDARLTTPCVALASADGVSVEGATTKPASPTALLAAVA